MTASKALQNDPVAYQFRIEKAVIDWVQKLTKEIQQTECKLLCLCTTNKIIKRILSILDFKDKTSNNRENLNSKGSYTKL